MAAVGGVSCDMVKGNAETLREQVEVWRPPGVDGVGAQALGKSEGVSHFTAVLYDTNAAIETWANSLRALAGSVATIVDDWGVSHTNMLIQRVGELAKRAAQIPGSTVEAIGRVPIEAIKQ